MLDMLSQPWPWYVGGPAIALVVFLLLWNGRAFGISSSLETMCSMAGAGRLVDFFNRDWTAGDDGGMTAAILCLGPKASGHGAGFFPPCNSRSI